MDLRLFVIEPQSLRRRLVCTSVEDSAGLALVGEAASLYDTEILEAESPDFFLVDAALLSTGHDGLATVSRKHPQSFFVLFGTHPDLDALLSCIKLPVRGFLSFNHLTGEDFVRSLQVIAYGGAVIEPISAQLLLEYLQGRVLPLATPIPSLSGLTEREDQVLERVRRGLSNKEIAMSLHISMGTVRSHLRTIFRKLDVTSRAGAAAIGTTSTHRNGKEAS